MQIDPEQIHQAAMEMVSALIRSLTYERTQAAALRRENEQLRQQIAERDQCNSD